MMCKCKVCGKEFIEYVREDDCFTCNDGDEEIDVEFGEGSYFRSCRSCGGSGIQKHIENEVCSEICLEIYIEDQLRH